MMATLVLTTMGSLIGGPVGGAIGALVGSGIDRTVLGQGRQGPRLGDLTVQTSAYGSAIPRLFGRMRVAGTVIWATDLKERSARSGGKGQPRTTSYSYSASFAVALSARRVRSIGRIWADGLLLRGAAGDWKTVTGFRFHDGSEAQAVDPLIAAIEGAEAPAYRGIAYVMFEDMQLAAYGNRIPSLRFEVEADAGPVTVGAIAAALSDGMVADATTTGLIGYAATGDSVRAAIETLADAVPMVLTEQADGLELREGDGATFVLAEGELGAAAGVRGGVRQAQSRQAAGTVADEVTLAYYDVARDYQAGMQRARRGGPGRRVNALELPATVSADVAKAIAERRLAADWAGRRRATVRLPLRRMALPPGAAVALPGSVEGWRVAGVTLDRMVVEVELVGVDAAHAVSAKAVPGRVLAEADRPQGATTIAVFELPPDGVAAADGMIRLSIAAAGVSPGWRSAMLEAGADGAASLEPVGRTAGMATMGVVPVAVPPAGSALFDDATQIVVHLLNDAMLLTGCSDAAMLAGANMALIGEELIQFGRAEQIGVARFRIGRLLRGRRGTEAAIGGHGAGERFVLIDPQMLAEHRVPATVVGSIITALATGMGDGAPVVATHRVTGVALRPPPPVHPIAVREADGTIRIAWVQRSGFGWDWSDGVDAPLGEEMEAYRLTIARAAGGERTVTVGSPSWRYPAALQAEDGNAGKDRLDLTLAQVGTSAVSLPLVATVRM